MGTIKPSYLLIMVLIVDVVLGAYMSALGDLGLENDYTGSVASTMFDSTNNGTTAGLTDAGQTAFFDPYSQTEIAEASALDYYSQQGNKVSGFLDYLKNYGIPVGSMLRSFEAPSLFSYLADAIWILVTGFAFWGVFWRWDM